MSRQVSRHRPRCREPPAVTEQRAGKRTMTLTPLLSRPNRALLSYLIDICGVLASLCLLYGWISDLQSGQAIYLSPTFYLNGFCLSPLFDCTHHTCSVLDAFGGTLFVAVALYLLLNKRGGDLPIAQLMPVAAYLFSHAYGHYVAGIELSAEPGHLDDGDKDMPWNEQFILAAILSIGPFGGINYLIRTGKMKEGLVANAIAVAVLVVYIAIYAIYVRKPRYALLYINVTILLSLAIPRVLAVGYRSEEDVSIRVDVTYLYANTAADLLVSAVVFAEPFYCDAFVAGIGGHLLFDASLLLQAVVKAMSYSREQSGTKTKNA